MDTYVYAISLNKDVHLAKEAELRSKLPITLCGRIFGYEGWRFGDETQTGSVATCRSCKAIADSRLTELAG